MATDSAPVSSLLSLLYRSYPHAVAPNATEIDLPAIAANVFPAISYTDDERNEGSHWVTSITKYTEALTDNDTEKTAELLDALNTHLATRTTLLGAKPSVADIAVYALLGPLVEKWSAEQRTGEKGYHHIVRYVDFVQNAPLFGLRIPEEEKIAVDVDDVKAPSKAVQPPKEESAKEKEKKEKKEKRAAARGKGGANSGPPGAGDERTVVVGQGKNAEKSAGGGQQPGNNNGKDGNGGGKKKEKAPKQPKQPKAPAPAPPLSPSLIDLRVGHILRAVNHPNADSLYVSTIACGDAPGTENTSQDEETGQTVRTVCSGLNGLIPLSEMQDRKIVTICNLKPVSMRGIKSAAMVLAASPRDAEGHGGPVELVSPPANAVAGERVFFEGWSEGQPDKQLNPKKKVWETVQPGFTTTDNLEVGFDSSAVPQIQEQAKEKGDGGPSTGGEGSGSVAKLVTQSGGVCTVPSLKGATVR